MLARGSSASGGKEEARKWCEMLTRQFDRIVCLVCFVFPLLSVNLLANEEEIDSLIYRGIELTLQENYNEAMGVFAKIIQSDAESPVGYFLQATVLQIKMLDFESNNYEREFYKLLDTTIAKTERSLTKNPDDAWVYFYLGASYGYKAAYEGKNQKYFSALHHGLKAISKLKKALKCDPNLYDAYLGLGTYHYFRTKATKFISWLPFIGDTREQGIAEIRLAMEKGKYSKTLAKNGLVWIFIEEKRYEEALSLAQELLREYSESRTFHWAPAEIYYHRKEWEKANDMFHQLLRLIEQSNLPNNYNLVVVKYRLAQTYFYQKKFGECIRECKEILQLPLDERSKSRLEDIISEIEELLKRAKSKQKSQKKE
ncbi:MAG: hypothetical protein AB1393_08690 [Candidatus Edwardsbacteria bacterium]